MILFQEDLLSIRTLTESDASLLVKWLSDPQVLEYYEGRDRSHDLALVMEHFYKQEQSTTRCIIQYNGEEIGYLQFYIIDDEEKEEYGYTGFQGNVYGMDQFIGEVSYWNKGIGTLLIINVVKYLFQKGANKIVMDPQAWNHRALRVYEKCGFTKKKLLPEHEWHEGAFRDCWLIEYTEL
ncbi:Bifunctional AAC/APH [compost metagenome]